MLNIYCFELSYFEIETTFDKFGTKLIQIYQIYHRISRYHLIVTHLYVILLAISTAFQMKTVNEH